MELPAGTQQLTLDENTLLIKYDPSNKSAMVMGAIMDKGFAYQLLGLARDAIYDFHKAQAEGNRITPVTLMPGRLQ